MFERRSQNDHKPLCARHGDSVLHAGSFWALTSPHAGAAPLRVRMQPGNGRAGILGSCGNAELFLLECSGLRVFFPPPYPEPEKHVRVGLVGGSATAVSPAVCKPLHLYCVVYIEGESVVLAIWELTS